jgi:hypothetical protein
LNKKFPTKKFLTEKFLTYPHLTLIAEEKIVAAAQAPAVAPAKPVMAGTHDPNYMVINFCP